MDGPEAQWLEREYEALYTNTLASLPPQCRLAFLAVREEGKSYAEAAQALGISAKMVGKHINRAHRVFRTMLREYGITPPPEKGSRRPGPNSKRHDPPAWSARPRRVQVGEIQTEIPNTVESV